MICLLCLCESTKFFANWNEDFGIAEIITKYFGIEIHMEDVVSSKICNTCWKHLDDFHRFWLFIKEKHQTFQELAKVKCDPLEDDFKKESSHWEKDDVKDVQLHELSIINESSFVKAELKSEEFKATNFSEEVKSDKDDLTLHDETGDDSDYLAKSEPRQLKESKHGKRCLPYKSKNTTSAKKQRKVFTAKKLKTVENTKLICEICNKESANKNALKQHMYRRHPTELELKYSCCLCVKKFAKKYILEQHLNWHRTSKRNICETCKKGYCTKQELKAHQKSDHADVFKIICDSCGKGFKTTTGYSNHYKQDHLGTTRPEAQCEICKEWLKNDSSLLQHMYKHRDESSGKDFVCKICGAVKSTKKRLSRHREYHHPNKMHKCTLCTKEFKIALALQEHVAAVHTGQPLYSCSFCPQTFKSNGNMYTHKKRVHPNEWVPKKISTTKKVIANRNLKN